MRTLVFLALVLTTSVPIVRAGPVPPPTPIRKPVPAGMSAEVIKKFVEAIVDDKAGNLEEAARAYDKAIEAGPTFANTYYNLGDVQRRMEKLDRAVKSYEKYLELEPDAPDKAEVARLIAQLKDADYTVVADGEQPGGVILFDGKLVGPSPQIFHVAPGSDHVWDRLSPTGSRHGRFHAQYDKVHHEILDDWSPRKRKDGDPPGNVYITSSYAFGTTGSWKDKDTGVEFSLEDRMYLPPGHYSTFPWNDNRLCVPLAFDVPRTANPSDVLYVYIDAKPRDDRRGGCQMATIRTQVVKVDAP